MNKIIHYTNFRIMQLYTAVINMCDILTNITLRLIKKMPLKNRTFCFYYDLYELMLTTKELDALYFRMIRSDSTKLQSVTKEPVKCIEH